jgi:hypothetical protein
MLYPNTGGIIDDDYNPERIGGRVGRKIRTAGSEPERRHGKFGWFIPKTLILLFQPFRGPLVEGAYISEHIVACYLELLHLWRREYRPTSRSNSFVGVWVITALALLARLGAYTCRKHCAFSEKNRETSNGKVE